MATTFLTKTLSASPTDNNKWTFSCWFKRTGFETQTLIYSNDGSTSNVTEVAISDAAKMVFQNKVGGSTTMNLTTNRLFRDTSAFYHVVAVFDSSNSTEADRQIIYINGVRETSFATNNPASLNEVSTINSGNVAKIGKGNTSEYFNGLMSYVAFVDGTAELPGIFGETDSTTGEWKIKTDITPSVAWGTNGFLILKNGNSLTDESTNSNNFTLGGGTLTNTEDCPDNNYPSVNINTGKVTDYLNSTGLRYGNTEINQTGNPGVFISTLANTTGKYYWEMLIDAVGYTTQGVIAYDALVQNGSVIYLYTPATGYGYVYTGNKGNNNSQVSYGDSYTSGDYISVAFDQTNGSIWFAKNGVWQNNATTAEIGAGTTTNAAYSSMPTNGDVYAPAFGLDNSAVTRINYGNGTFGTTTLSTTYSPTVGDTGAKFKYNIIPTGFTALSTKGLNL